MATASREQIAGATGRGSASRGRVLVLSAGVGGGHDAAARALCAELLDATPEVEVALRNGLASGAGARVLLERCLRWQLTRCPWAYSLSYAACVRWAPGRTVAAATLHRAIGRRLRKVIERAAPDIIVSTYPGVTTVLGMMRERAQLDVPVCALVTDIAGLRFWAHPGVDLHVACYAESLPEIARVAPGASAIVARAPLAVAHRRRRHHGGARAGLGLAPGVPLIVVSGGGWGVGDLAGAIVTALELGEVQVVAVCGQNARAARRLARRHRYDARVRVLGHTTAMADLLAAASVLVHSTGGMTCLESAAHGCPVVAYGFRGGHVGRNMAAMERGGLLRQAHDRGELARRLAEAIDSPRPPRPDVEQPAAGSVVVEQIASRLRLR